MLNWLVWIWFPLAWNWTVPQTGPAPGPPLAGIRTTDRLPVGTLIQDIFVGGACKNVSNIKPIGNIKGIGYFENGSSIIGIDRGILLSTGPVGNAEGPNEKGDEGGDFKDTRGDADLRQLTSAPVFDAVGVEFDFVPLDSIVTFRYVFASEEYCEFVGTSFNDVFGFFVSGPGISGSFSKNSQNVALIPGTQEFVAINTINHLRNQEYFVRNEPRRDAERCQIEWKETANLGLIGYDGFTKALTATLKLIPCETYTLRLVIADVSDGNYDSAVFLEAESFNIGGNINLATGSGNGQDTITEACDNGYFVARRRAGEKTDMPLTIGIRVSDASTATSGQDFTPLPKQITIPAGVSETTVPIELLIDDIDEPVESIILELDFPCACISDTARLYIKDPPPLISSLENQTICIGASATLHAGASGGVPGYTYRWSTGDTTEAIQVMLERDSTFLLTITDACKRQRVSRVRLTRRPPPVIRIAALREVCQGDTVLLPVAMEGQPPFRFVYSVGNDPPDTVRNVFANSHFLSISKPGTVRILSFSDALCTGIAPDSAEIRHYTLQTITRTRDLSCAGAEDGSIAVEVSGGAPPYAYTWKGWGSDAARIDKLPPGDYALTVTDANRCSATFEMRIQEPPALEPVTFDCRDLRGSFLILSAKGGTPPYQYSVDGLHYTDQGIFEQLNPGQYYQLRIRDARGCQIEQNFLMPSRYERMVELEPSVKLELGERYTISPRLNIPLSLVAQLEWSPAAHLSCTDCLRPVLTALKNETYLLKVTDIFGCSDGAAIIVKLNRQAAIFVPTAFSPNGDGANDRLVIYADTKQVRSVQRMQVFNRWGLMVFDGANLLPNSEAGAWDGRHRGTLLEAGVYIYKAILELVDGSLTTIEGDFTLMR